MTAAPKEHEFKSTLGELSRITDERRESILTMDEQQWRSFVDDQLRENEKRSDNHRDLLAENTAMTRKIVDSTAEIIEAVEVARHGLSFFSALGRLLNRLARWAAPILAAVGAIWAITHGNWPKGD